MDIRREESAKFELICKCPHPAPKFGAGFARSFASEKRHELGGMGDGKGGFEKAGSFWNSFLNHFNEKRDFGSGKTWKRVRYGSDRVKINIYFLEGLEGAHEVLFIPEFFAVCIC